MEAAVTPYMTNGGDLPTAKNMGPSLTASGTHPSVPANGTNNLSFRTCSGCGRSIQDRFLLHALDRYWHTGCLTCSCCQAQLGEIGKSCFTKAGMILCRNDYVRLFGCGGSCMGCGQSIPASDLVYRVQGSVYHVKCFVCGTCRHPLQSGDRYGLVNGRLVCEHDYPKLVKAQLSAANHLPLTARTAHKVC